MKKQRVTVVLPEYVTDMIERRAELLEESKSEYSALIVEWWYSSGCPPVHGAEEMLLKTLNINPLDDMVKTALRESPKKMRRAPQEGKKTS